MLKIYGGSYGGWMVEASLIPEGSTVISAGIGEDISFDLAIQKACKCNIVGVDPTQKAQRFIEKQANLKDFEMLSAALSAEEGEVKMFHNKNPQFVSESVLSSHVMADNEGYIAPAVTLPLLLKKFPRTSLIKMDIEGSEYEVIDALREMKIPQVCIEFHHFCTEKSLEDTKVCCRKMQSFGYEVFPKRPAVKNWDPLREVTFVHQDFLEGLGQRPINLERVREPWLRNKVKALLGRA